MAKKLDLPEHNLKRFVEQTKTMYKKASPEQKRTLIEAFNGIIEGTITKEDLANIE